MEKNSIELQHVKEEVTPLLIVVSVVLKLVRFHMFWSRISTLSHTFNPFTPKGSPFDE